MKRLEDIERLTVEELETIARDPSVPVPEALEGRIRRSTVGAGHRSWWAVAAVALVAVGFSLTRERPPRDTYDDPALAYAEVEKAFTRIADGLSGGRESAGKTVDLLHIAQEVFQ